MHINLYIPDNIPVDKTGFLKGILTHSGSKKNEIFTLIISNHVEAKFCDTSIGTLNDATLHYQSKKKNWICLQTLPNFSVNELSINSMPMNLCDITSIIYKSTDVEQSVIVKNIYREDIDPISSFAKFSRLNSIYCDNSFSEVKWSWLQLIILALQLYFKLILLLESFFIKCDLFLYENLSIKSCFMRQILLRIKQIKSVMVSTKKSENYLLTCRLVGIITVDVLLGIFCVYLLFTATSSTEIHSKVKSVTSILAGNVQELLMQLRGAPAGLKLNQPLTEAYAAFFSYIVHLWTIYLDRANSAMAIVSYFFMFIGVLGLSTQAALMADIFSLVSLHIYCVYVYAARIHMLQVSIVGSQWRAFRGKKWNPLKQRTDCLDEFSQGPLRKILTVFVFTVVVFLLPTTTVYYAVFMLMRLCFVSLNGLITLFIWSLNYNPVFVFALFISKSPKIKGEIYFEPLPFEEHDRPALPLLKMSLQPSSLKKIISISNEKTTMPVFPSPNFNRLCSSLIYADCLL